MTIVFIFPSVYNENIMSKPIRYIHILDTIINIYTLIGIIFVVLATILLLTPALPYLWYRIDTSATSDEATVISDTSSGSQPMEENAPENNLPPFDATLTATNTLIIQSIGVNGAIHEGTDAHAALENGIWRANDFGTPETTMATILAAHRFGYIYWTNEFRTSSSFYNLPKTGVGDTIEIIWNQRRYQYEIYRAEDNSVITDYNADLILYTCRLFNSPTRVFRYANRVN